MASRVGREAAAAAAYKAYTIMAHTSYRGRFAPSPTGELHAGSLFTALVSWVRARQAGGQWLLRVEDIDPPREVPGSAAAIADEIARLGLTPDAPVLYQSTRDAAYAAALDCLRERGLAFACRCSRADLAASGGVHRDGRCLAAPHAACPPAWRLRVPHCVIAFDDVLQGHQQQDLHAAVGDFVLRRADGLWSYQLACVVDDAEQGITEVVRGADLLDSTPRQIHLQHLLGLPTPRYLHVPLVTDGHGRKLSKSAADRPLAGRPVMELLRGALAWLGLGEAAMKVGDRDALLAAAVRHFDLANLAHDARLVQCSMFC